MKFQNTDFCVETIHFIIKRDPKEYKKVTKTHNLQGSSKTKRKIFYTRLVINIQYYLDLIKINGFDLFLFVKI